MMLFLEESQRERLRNDAQNAEFVALATRDANALRRILSGDIT
jgi:hypothetical protein